MTEPPQGQEPIEPGSAFSPPPPPPPQGGAPMGSGGPAGWVPPPPPPLRPSSTQPPGRGPVGAPGMMPPGMMAPPPPGYWPPPPPRGGGFVRGIFVTLATSILGISILLNVYLLAATGLMSGTSGGKSNVLEEGDSSQKIAVIPVSGTIMDDVSAKFDRHLGMAEKDENVKAVVLEVDTPGGSVTASDEIYHRVMQYRKSHPNTKVIVTQGGLATSGGYYVSCAADYVFAQPTTLTGNIGVLMPRFNLSRLMDKWGIEETTIASTGATFKNAGSMFKPEKPEETAYIQGIADNAFKQFKSVVSTGRAGKLNGTIDAIANGKVYTANEALQLGLVDAIGYAKDAYAYAASAAGLSKPTIVRYQDAPSLADLLRGESNVSQQARGGVTINGVNVRVGKDALQELMTPRLMYLWRGE